MTTDVNPLKRVRVDDLHNLLSDGSEDCPEIFGCNSPNLLTPKANALNRLQYAIASLPSPVKKTITQQSRKIIDFIILIEKKNDFIKRAADNEYAPRSARVNFKLTTAAQLIETEPFKELVRQCDKDILEFQQKLKMHTIAVAKNELQLFKSEILDIIHKIVRILNKYYIIKKGATNTDDNVKTSFLLTPDIPELEKVIKQLSRLTNNDESKPKEINGSKSDTNIISNDTRHEELPKNIYSSYSTISSSYYDKDNGYSLSPIVVHHYTMNNRSPSQTFKTALTTYHLIL